MRFLISILILALTVSAPSAHADNRSLSDLEKAVFSSQSVASGATVTAVVRTGYAETFSLDSYFTTTGTLAGTIYFTPSNNSLSGTATTWPSLDSTDTSAYTTSLTLSPSRNPWIKKLTLFPSGYTRIRFLNSTSGAPATISRFTLYKR